MKKKKKRYSLEQIIAELKQDRVRALLSGEHFSVDDTLIQA